MISTIYKSVAQRAYQHLQAENSQLREKICKLEDRQSEEDGEGRRDKGPELLARSSPDGQDVTETDKDRDSTRH